MKIKIRSNEMPFPLYFWVPCSLANSGGARALIGRCAPQLEAELSAVLDGAEALILDMSALEYLSSAGLRVILAAHTRMSRQGGMVVRHVNATIMEVFEVTGFTDILTIE